MAFTPFSGHLQPDTPQQAGLQLVCVFIVYVAVIGGLLWAKPLQFSSDVFAFMPQASDPQHRTAETLLENIRTADATRLTVMVSGEPRAAKAVAHAVQALASDSLPVLTDFGVDQQQWFNTYFSHRYALLSSDDREALAQGDGKALYQRALQQLYSGASTSNAYQLSHDPFNLFNHYWQQQNRGDSTTTDGLQVVYTADQTHYLVQFTFDSLHSHDIDTVFTQPVQQIATAAEPQGITVAYTGVPVIFAAVEQQARQEISTIGVLSMVFIVALVLYAFRSPWPVLWISLCIAFSVSLALVVLNLWFNAINVLALVFATSLIGLVVDFCFHVLVDYRQANGSPYQSVAMLRRAILLSMASSIAAYVLMLLGAAEGLAQVAVMVCIGMLSGVAFVFWVLPRLLVLVKHDQKPLRIQIKSTGQPSKTAALWAVAIPVMVLGLHITPLTLGDDIRQIASLPEQIADMDDKIKSVLNPVENNVFVLQSAPSLQSLLQQQEALLDNTVGDDAKMINISQWLPSLQRQQANKALVEQHLLTPWLPSFASQIGLTETAQAQAVTGLHDDAGLRFSHAQNAMPDLLRHSVAETRDGQWHGLSFVSNVRDIDHVKTLVETTDGAVLIDFVTEKSLLLSAVKTRVIYAFSLMLLVAVVALLLWRRQLSVLWMFWPIVVTLGCLLLLAAIWAIEINLFHVLAAVLVVGLGLDYAFVFGQSATDVDGATVSCLLSALTSLFAFGLLGLSRTQAIAEFGLTVLAGVSLVFLFTVVIAPLLRAPHAQE